MASIPDAVGQVTASYLPDRARAADDSAYRDACAALLARHGIAASEAMLLRDEAGHLVLLAESWTDPDTGDMHTDPHGRFTRRTVTVTLREALP